MFDLENVAFAHSLASGEFVITLSSTAAGKTNTETVSLLVMMDRYPTVVP